MLMLIKLEEGTMEVSPVEEVIRKHTDSITSGRIQSPRGSCPKCSESPDTYKLHECRKRSFRFIFGCFVRKVISLLARWKCPICGHTFTEYPEFALPYKRYVVMDIDRLGENYLENSHSYQDTVSCEEGAIGYEQEDGEIDERQLSPSTPWRWLSFLGSMNNLLTVVLNLIRQKAADSYIFRGLLPLFQGKYRSRDRKTILQNAWKLLQANPIFQHLFADTIFPRYATGYAQL
jgi:hypothetical protein